MNHILDRQCSFEPLVKSASNEHYAQRFSGRSRYGLLALYTVAIASLTLCFERSTFFRTKPSIDFSDLLKVAAGYRLDVPLWAQKDTRLDIRETDKKGCLVHVGKTAGTTLACYLGFMYPECAPDDDGPGMHMARGLLPASTTHLIHTQYDDCDRQEFDFYLFILRDPLKRIQSWFTYELPENGLSHGARKEKQKQLFTECDFQTLNELSERGLAPQAGSEELDDSNALCQRRARMAVSGEVGYSTHNYYNFNYYLRQVERTHSPNIDIVVIRTEHLHDDWRSIEEEVLQGPRGLNVTFARKRNASPKREEDMHLSDVARSRICAALCNEIQVYKELLQRAINLKPEDVELSIAELVVSCPLEAAADSC